MNQVNITSKPEEQAVAKRPLSVFRAIWYFLAAGLGLRFCVAQFLPWLVKQGLTPYEAFIVSFTVPMAILFALSFALAQNEGVPMTRRGLTTRFRLKRLTLQDIKWMVIGLVIMIVGGILLSPTRIWLLKWLPTLQPGAHFPAIANPMLQNADLPEALSTWLGNNVVGNWSIVVLALIFLFFNIFGEELFWRGYILPRQELANGRYAWLVHGLLWNLFHLPIYPWYILFGLPMTLAISFVAQKTGNTWTTIIMHTLANLSLTMMIIGAVIGSV